MDGLSGLWVSIIGRGVSIYVISNGYDIACEKGKKEFFIYISNPVFIPFYLVASLGVAVNGIGYAIFSLVSLVILVTIVANLGGFER